MSEKPVNTVGILFALYVLTSLAHVIYHFFLVTLVPYYHSFYVVIFSLLNLTVDDIQNISYPETVAMASRRFCYTGQYVVQDQSVAKPYMPYSYSF